MQDLNNIVLHWMLPNFYPVIQNRLWHHNFPRKLASKLLCIRGSRRERKRKQWLIFLLKRVSFLKNTSSFSFSPLPYSGASNLGKINANFSGEIVTSWSVLDHRVPFLFWALLSVYVLDTVSLRILCWFICIRNSLVTYPLLIYL